MISEVPSMPFNFMFNLSLTGLGNNEFDLLDFSSIVVAD
jgi:hypothetical protein